MKAFTRARDTIVAYLSLFFGAGLSVGANLADTLRIRGDAVDVIDIALAVGPPLAALLVVELFVSEWPRTWSVQSVRWVATLIVGTLATIVSWIHIHELLAARGQNPYVAILWPVAIDGLAIMAMAKLLVTRGHVATPMAMATDGHVLTEDSLAKPMHDLAMATQPDDPTVDMAKEMAKLNDWSEGWDLANDTVANDLANEAQAFLASGQATVKLTPPVIPGRAVPADVRALIVAMLANGATGKEIDEAVQEMTGKAPGTVRKYRNQVKKEGTDGQE